MPETESSPPDTSLELTAIATGSTVTPITALDATTLDATTLDATTLDATAASQTAVGAGQSTVLSCFLSTFVTIFLAEVGDKTQLATLLMSAQSHKPWTVFAGAAAALIATSLVGVLLGRWLSTVLKPRTLERVTGAILAVVSVLLFIDVLGMS
jgi:Ca2+/H+ antiporter, TMEM165/GDT1 family